MAVLSKKEFYKPINGFKHRGEKFYHTVEKKIPVLLKTGNETTIHIDDEGMKHLKWMCINNNFEDFAKHVKIKNSKDDTKIVLGHIIKTDYWKNDKQRGGGNQGARLSEGAAALFYLHFCSNGFKDRNEHSKYTNKTDTEQLIQELKPELKYVDIDSNIEELVKYIKDNPEQRRSINTSSEILNDYFPYSDWYGKYIIHRNSEKMKRFVKHIAELIKPYGYESANQTDKYNPFDIMFEKIGSDVIDKLLTTKDIPILNNWLDYYRKSGELILVSLKKSKLKYGYHGWFNIDNKKHKFSIDHIDIETSLDNITERVLIYDAESSCKWNMELRISKNEINSKVLGELKLKHSDARHGKVGNKLIAGWLDCDLKKYDRNSILTPDGKNIKESFKEDLLKTIIELKDNPYIDSTKIENINNIDDINCMFYNAFEKLKKRNKDLSICYFAARLSSKKQSLDIVKNMTNDIYQKMCLHAASLIPDFSGPFLKIY